MMIFSFVKKYFLLFVCLFVSGCNVKYINRGPQIDFIDFEKIAVGSDGLVEVVTKVGFPNARTSVVSYDGSFYFYYIFTQYKKAGFLPKKIVDLRSVAVLFNCDGIVQQVYVLNKNVVKPVKYKTKVNDKFKVINELKGLQYFIGGDRGARIKINPKK